MNKLIALITLFFVCSAPTFAKDEIKKLETTEYSPEYCAFTATFPEEPYITKQCENDKKDSCYNLISYTKVFDMDSTVRVEMICNPSTPEMFKNFTPEAMEATVRAMTKDTVIEEHETNTRDGGEYRQTSLLGRGKQGLDDTLYIAQLWIADKSIMSVEAQLIGKPRDDADKLFAEILRSIGYTKEIKADKKEAKQEDQKID